MAKDAGRAWAWPTVAVGVLVLTSPTLGEGLVDVRALARAGVQTALGLLLIAIGGAALSARPVRQALRVGPARPAVSALELTSWVVGLLALSFALDLGLDWLDVREGSRLAEIEAVLAGLQGGDTVIALLGIALAPAISEEIVFRGLVLGALLTRAPAWAAVAIAALLFGAAHLDLVHGAAALVLGVYLGAMAIATGSVRPGIVAHAGNNAFAVLAPAWTGALAEQPWVIGLLATGLLVGLATALLTIGRRIARSAPGPA